MGFGRDLAREAAAVLVGIGHQCKGNYPEAGHRLSLHSQLLSEATR